MVAFSHMWLFSTSSVASMAERVNFKFCLILLNLNLNSYHLFWLVATISDSWTPIFGLGCQSSTHQGGGKVGDLTVQGVNFHLHFLFAVRLSICPQLFRVQSLSLWTSLNLQSLEAVGGWGGGQSSDCMKSGTESGDLGATHNVFQLVLLFSLPSEGPVTQLGSSKIL